MAEGETIHRHRLRVHLDDDDDEDDDDEDALAVELERRTSGLSPVTRYPSVTFSVSGQMVFTNAETRLERTSCGALTNDAGIDVRGRREPNGSVRATRIERED